MFLFLVARFLAPIIYVAPPASSFTYRPSLPLPSLSTALGALIARLNELEPKEGSLFAKDAKKSVARKRLKELAKYNFSLGVAPVEDVLYGVQRTGIIRRINRYAKDKQDKSDALAHEYSIVYAFEIAVGLDEKNDNLIELVKKALSSITRVGDSESLVTPVEIEEVEPANSIEALGVLPAERIENQAEIILYRGSLFPASSTYSTSGDEILRIRHLAFSLRPDRKARALVARTLRIKPDKIGKEVVVIRPERPIALVHYSALMKTGKKAKR